MKNLKKVVLVTEYLNPPYDEGIKKTAYNLYLELEKKYELQVICRFGFEKDNINVVNTNALYFSSKIKLIIKEFHPDSIVYLPFQSSTFASYLRLKVFSIYSKNSKIILIALQPKPLKYWQSVLVQFIKPQIAFTPSPSLNAYWNKVGVKNQLIPLITDFSTFKPLNHTADQQKLRVKYKLKTNDFIISHMGHLNEGRNLKTLIPLQKSGVQVIIVASSSTPEDAKGNESLKNELLNAGILIFDGYIDQIQEVYQLSDIYIFPVLMKNSSIGMPLSILEARSCGTPVISTNYGSVESFLGDDFGGITYSQPNDFLNKVRKLKSMEHRNFNKTNVLKLNQLFFNTIHQVIKD